MRDMNSKFAPGLPPGRDRNVEDLVQSSRIDGQTRGILGSGKVIFKSEIGRSGLSVRFGGSTGLLRS